MSMIIAPARFAVQGGGGGVGISARRWRIRSVSQPSNFDLNEIHMRSVVDGPDITTGGVGSVSSTAAGSAAAAFDNNTGTRWASTAPGTGNWAAYDFGAGNAVVVNEMAIHFSADWRRVPAQWAIETSEDGATWTVVSTGSFGQYVLVDRYIRFPVGVRKLVRYRINCDAIPAGKVYASFGEITLTGAPPFVEVFTSGDSFGIAVTNAFDGNNNSRWVSNSSGLKWVGFSIDTTTTSAITLNLRGPHDTGDHIAPSAFSVDGSTDEGATWTRILDRPAEPAWALSELRSYALPAF